MGGDRERETTRSAVSDVAEVVGGLLEAQYLLTDQLSEQTAVGVLQGLGEQRSLWAPAMFADDADAERAMRVGGRQLPLWVRPPAEPLATLAPLLDRAWEVAGLRAPSSWAAPALRLTVLGLDDQEHLRGRSVGPWNVVTHVQLPAGRLAWRWPLRIALAGDVALLVTGRWAAELYRVTPTGEAVVELAVVTPSSIGRLDGLLATVAVVVGADGWDPAEFLDSAVRRGLAGVALVPDAPPGMVEMLVEQLSHDLPLDVALAATHPAARLLAADELLELTSIRMWSSYVGEQLGSEAMVDLARTMAFDHESGGASAVVAAASALDQGALDELTNVRLARSAAAEPPPAVELPQAGADPPTEPAAPPPAPKGDRWMQCELSDAEGTVRTDGFVRGERHQLRVCIAAERHAGAVVGAVAFVHPSPGKAARLTVVSRVRATAARPVRRRLDLPATADSGWTRPIPIVVADDGPVEVEIVVLYRGRAVQTAVLSGPVVEPGPVGPAALQLHVDADVPPVDLDARSPASTVIVSSVGVDGPQLVDLSRETRPLDPLQLTRVNEAIRRILRDAFAAGVTDLAGAAPVLTKLAVLGSTLRQQLKGNRDEFHDKDPWIHLVGFGPINVPFELIYTHPLPANDESVPVCAAALGGATSCTEACAEQASEDVVCPFAFWATSKVVERRQHVDDRVGLVPPAQRKIEVRRGAVVGSTDKANQRDPTAADRIAAAVEHAVAAGSFTRVRTWDELAAAVSATSRRIVVLVTHTVEPAAANAVLGTSLEIGGELRPVHRIDQRFVNPAAVQPGPVVLTLGCDTGELDAGFSDWVGLLHAARAEVVVSTISPVPGKEIADLVERMFRTLPALLDGPGPHRCGALLTSVRQATIATGDVLALSLTASGDADVELVG